MSKCNSSVLARVLIISVLAVMMTKFEVAIAGNHKYELNAVLLTPPAYSGCGDVWSDPDYYIRVRREDAKVEGEIAAVQQKISAKESQREKIRNKLDPLLEQQQASQAELEEGEEATPPLSAKQQAQVKQLKKEIDNVDKVLRPLNDTEERLWKLIRLDKFPHTDRVLTVYPNDKASVYVMEKDLGGSETCYKKNLKLDSATLKAGILRIDKVLMLLFDPA